MSDMQQQPNTVWVRAFTPAGRQIGITFAFADTLPTAVSVDALLTEAGYLIVAPGAEPGEEIETIVTCVRRVHVNAKGHETPVIDMYPEWRGEYGQFRFVGSYLNDATEIAAFEAASGLKLVSMPLYDAQAPLQRNEQRAHKCEVRCVTPFRAAKKAGRETEVNGVMQRTWKFARYVDAGHMANSSAATPRGRDKGIEGLPHPFASADARKTLFDEAQRLGFDTPEAVMRALRINKLSDWDGSYSDAVAALTDSLAF